MDIRLNSLRRRAGTLALVGLLVSLVLAATVAPAGAVTEPITGTAVTSGGNGFTNTDFTYTTSGILGSGTIHNEFVLIPVTGGSGRKAPASSREPTARPCPERRSGPSTSPLPPSASRAASR